MMTWVSKPHFYHKDETIVLYVGEDMSVIDVLNQTLGAPVAVGQTQILAEPDMTTVLTGALTDRDFSVLEKLMGDPFIIGYWRSQGEILAPPEAIEQLQLNLLPEARKVSIIRNRAQFPDLGALEPEKVFGPEVKVVDLVYSTGWGSDGLGEALLALAEDADGSLYWHGILYSLAGFAGGVDTLPPELPTSFEAAFYQNAENGFEIRYPSSWTIDEQIFGSRASGAQFYDDGEIVFSSIVFLWDPKEDLEAYSEQRKQGWSSSSTVLSEEEILLANGQRALQFEIEGIEGPKTYSVLTEVGENYLELAGFVDLDLFSEIVQTLRPFDVPLLEPITELPVFEERLVAAVASGNLVEMQSLMDESFGFAFWGSEGYEVGTGEAIQQLRTGYLPPGAPVDFDVEAPDLSEILGPIGILTSWDPATNPVSALFSVGWGIDGQDEAFLIITQNTDGSYAWDGVILASGSHGGFEGLYETGN